MGEWTGKKTYEHSENFNRHVIRLFETDVREIYAFRTGEKIFASLILFPV